MGSFLSFDSNCELLEEGVFLFRLLILVLGLQEEALRVKTKGGQYVITPDNGTLTHIKKIIGIEEAREIDETKNRLPHSGESYTFHGRDIYAYTSAKLAAGIISFEDIGSKVDVASIVELTTIPATMDHDIINGTIDVLDVRLVVYGQTFLERCLKSYMCLLVNVLRLY